MKTVDLTLPEVLTVTPNVAVHGAIGVYFYRLQAGTFVQTKKLLLLH